MPAASLDAPREAPHAASPGAERAPGPGAERAPGQATPSPAVPLAPVPPHEKRLLRELARAVAEAAALPVQVERARLWRELNALNPVRPLVLLNPQNGWEDLVPEAGLVCRDALAREAERTLRMRLFRAQHIPDDCPVTALCLVPPVVVSSGWGVEEKTIRSEARGAFRWDPPLKVPADIAKLRPARLSVDREQSAQRLAFFQELFGDTLSVAPAGVRFCRCGLTRKLIMLRGLDTFLLDLYDEPGLVHDLMAFLRDEMMRELDFYEAEGLLSVNNGPEDWTGSGGMAITDRLPGPGSVAGSVRTRHMFVWGESQETGCIGPDQFGRFVLRYQLPVLSRFGLVDYGCCEALDSRLDLLLASLPRLRWVAVSPWADRRLAAEKLGARFVYCYKPNPALICRETPDWEAAERELRETLAIARGCRVSLVMKDTTSFFGDPRRATRWVETAMRVAQESA